MGYFLLRKPYRLQAISLYNPALFLLSCPKGLLESNFMLSTSPIISNKKLLEIQQERDALAIRISQIQGRLLSGYSRPLEDSFILLLKQDMKLICQTTDLLIQINQKRP